MITLIIFAIIALGLWIYFKILNETTPPVAPKKNDFKTTLFREMQKIKENNP